MSISRRNDDEDSILYGIIEKITGLFE